MKGLVYVVILALTVPFGLSAQGLIDVGGHRLDVSVRGNDTPVVILESGMGEGREYWGEVQDSLSRFVRVLSYSRSGLGASDYGRRTGTVDAVEELRTLLARLQIHPPFVLVGHSIGAWYVRTFAAQHPDEVAGLVLVDGTAELAYQDFARRWPDFWDSYDEAMAPYLAGWPQAARDEEDFNLDVIRGRGLPETVPLPDIPLAMITATRPDSSWLGGSPEGIKIWLGHHQAFLTQSSRAMHLISGRTGHMVQEDEPGLILQAVRFVLESITLKAR